MPEYNKFDPAASSYQNKVPEHPDAVNVAVSPIHTGATGSGEGLSVTFGWPRHGIQTLP